MSLRMECLASTSSREFISVHDHISSGCESARFQRRTTIVVLAAHRSTALSFVVFPSAPRASCQRRYRA